MTDAHRPMAIDTKSQMLLRISELRQMRNEAAQREASGTMRQLDRMIAKAEGELRALIGRETTAD
jgi:hypothetical protein